MLMSAHKDGRDGLAAVLSTRTAEEGSLENTTAIGGACPAHAAKSEIATGHGDFGEG